MAQNVSTLIGSDVKDWDKYEKCELPQLKIRIDSFDNFKKLLKKDDQVLRGYLNKKLKQEITISPYENCSIKLPIYDDVNVFFGGKGTGKTTILKKIEEYFSSKGISGISKYYAGEKNDIYKKLTESRFEDNDINKFEINDNLIDDFNIVLKYENPKVTPISQYVKWIDYRCKDHKFFFQEKNFSKILDLSNYERNFKQYENLCKNIKDIMNNDLFRRSNFSNIENFEKIFQEIKTGARNELYKVFCKCYVNKLFYDTINKMKKKYEKSTGFAAKPTQTGLVIMYDNLIRIHNSIKKISSQFKKDSIKELSKIGKLIDKGEIYLCREISINPTQKGDIKQKKCTKKNLIDIMNQIFEIEKKCFTSSLPSLMNDLITKLADCNINKIEDFMTLNTYTTTSDGLKYDLSNGEQSMIVLSKALSNENDEIFILDEPEMSVGHKYINDIIVPRIIELARANKIIIISTHDANIAIRTLPYLSVYREDCGNKVYKTYIGSAFCDIMTEYGSNNTLNWVKISMDVLEGGKTAFNERSEVYGDEKY